MRSREIIVEKPTSALDGNINSLGRPITSDPAAFWAWFGKSKIKDKQGRPLVVFHGTDSDFSQFDPEFSNINSGTGVPRGAFVFSDHAGVASSYSAAQFDVHGWRDPKIGDAFRELMKTGSFTDQMEFLEQHPAGYDDYKDGGNVMPVYLRMVKPLIVNAKGESWNRVYFQTDGEAPEEFTTNEIAKVAMEKGYDGCIIRNVTDVSKGPRHVGTTFFVFSPNQIKSAISNKGTFRPDSDHIQEDALDESMAVGMLSIRNLLLSGKSIKQAFADLVRGKLSATKGPVVVAPNDGQYALMDGYHRVLQAILAGQTKVRGKRDAMLGLYYAIPKDAWVFDPKSPTFGLETLGISGDEIESLRSKLTESEKLELPDIEVGDEIQMGKFKNRKATVKGFAKDDHNQPVLKTTKGDQKLFKPRLSKLMTEGLISIPPKMHEHIDFLLTYNLLWKMRDGFRGKTKELAEHYAAFKKEVAALGEELPREPYATDRNVFAWNIPVSLNGLPATYADLKPRVSNIRFAIDWRPTKAIGGWRVDKDALIVYPMSLDYLTRYPSARSHPEDLKIALGTLRETISHELRHMVQLVILHDHPEQARQRPGYEKHGVDYFASPIEFDPMIGSSVQEFLELWTEYGKGDLSKAVKQYTGMMPSGTFDTFKTNEFFKSLKKGAPERHKIAASKFVRELRSRL